jgi:hypothetical protein
MASTLPRKEEDFFIVQGIIMDIIEENLDAWFIDKARFNGRLKPLRQAYEKEHLKCVNREEATRSMLAVRNARRKEYESELRKEIGSVKNNSYVSDLELDVMGISHGKGGGKPIGPSEYSPLVEGDTSISTRVKIMIRNLKTAKYGKPRGATIAYLRIGILGVDPDDYELEKYRIDEIPLNPDSLPVLVYVSNGQVHMEFKKHQRGLKLVVSACWVNRVGKQGPWSEIQVIVVP